MSDDVIIFGGILFNDAHFLDFLYIEGCRSIKDRKFRAIDMNKAVVDAKGIEGRESMLNR